MGVKLQTFGKVSEPTDPVMESARQIIRESWLANGMTAEQWERFPIEADVYEMLIAQGRSEREAGDYLESASWEDIQRRHREMYPRRYERNGAL